jgi:SAM-dependent methyltransferase
MAYRDCVVCCDNSAVTQYCLKEGQEYVRCGQCGLIYINKLKPATELYKAYSGNRLKSLRRKLMAPFRGFHQTRNFDQSMKRAEAIFDAAQSFVTGNEPNSRRTFLDIGCNKCFLLAVAIERGWDAYGNELVPELTAPFRHSYKDYADHVHNGRFEDTRRFYRDDMFNLVTAIDVIEHFEDVEKDMRGIYDVLKPGGAFVVQTPDVACPQARELGCDWGALKPLEHLHLFDITNLETLARRIGFNEVIAHPEFETADGNFVAILRKAR